VGPAAASGGAPPQSLASPDRVANGRAGGAPRPTGARSVRAAHGGLMRPIFSPFIHLGLGPAKNGAERPKDRCSRTLVDCRKQPMHATGTSRSITSLVRRVESAVQIHIAALLPAP